jgi:CHAT domain-containing protein
LATKESFRQLNGKHSPSVIHIATHGFFFPDPKRDLEAIKQVMPNNGKVYKRSDNPLFRSGLLFAGANIGWQGKSINGADDGILTSYEVSSMYLPHTKLVVLSACETALGDIRGSEGVYGLQRAFKMAGAEYLIMSLWKVPDKETAEFMEELYKLLFAHQSISQAFYHAQTIMKNKYRNDPFKWGAWVLIR